MIYAKFPRTTIGRVWHEPLSSCRSLVVVVPTPPAPPRKPCTWTRAERRDRVLRAICRKHGVTMEQITGASRARTITPARQEIMWWLVNRLGLSLSAAGRITNREHTTVWHGAKRHATRHGLPMKGIER